jgi:hypothetical protein
MTDSLSKRTTADLPNYEAVGLRVGGSGMGLGKGKTGAGNARFRLRSLRGFHCEKQSRNSEGTDISSLLGTDVPLCSSSELLQDFFHEEITRTESGALNHQGE